MNGLAVDWITQNVYWTDARYNIIGVVPMAIDSRMWKMIVDTDLTSPQDVVVDPKRQSVYISISAY